MDLGVLSFLPASQRALKALVLAAIVFGAMSTSLFAQRQASNWVFGRGAAVNFGPPVSTSRQVHFWAIEPAATWSDPTTGRLVLYTDGQRVYNSSHTLLQNGSGLLSGTSSTTGALILPYPGRPGHYFIFTTPDYTDIGQQAKTRWLMYSVADMTFGAGMGRLIEKNRQVVVDVSEKMTATINCRGDGYWLVTHHAADNVFYSIRVGADGVDPSIVTSRLGFKIGPFPQNYYSGHLKLSPDAKTLVMNNFDPGFCEIYDFDNRTGQVTNAHMLVPRQENLRYYGASFSFASNRLYVTQHDFENDVERIISFDVTLGSKPAIAGSASTLVQTPMDIDFPWVLMGALQLAPDGRIYQAIRETNFLAYITNPDSSTRTATYTRRGIDLQPASSEWGLPVYPDYIFARTRFAPKCESPRAAFTVDTVCAGSPLVVGNTSAGATRLRWFFTGASPAEFTGSQPTGIVYPRGGRYTIRLIAENSDGADTAEREVVVLSGPDFSAGSDFTLCQGDSVQIGQAPLPGYSYRWEPALGLSSVTVSNPFVFSVANRQTYTVMVLGPTGCITRDTIQITRGRVTAQISSDTAICFGTPAQLRVSGGQEVVWSPTDGLSDPRSFQPIAQPLRTTRYKALVRTGSCSDSAEVTVTVTPEVKVVIRPDTTICSGDSVELRASVEGATIVAWLSNGTLVSNGNQVSIQPVQTGIYVFQASVNGTCQVTDSVLIAVSPFTQVQAGPDVTVCAGDTVSLGGSNGGVVRWSPSDGLDNPTVSNPRVSPLQTTTYVVESGSGRCISRDTVVVMVQNVVGSKKRIEACQGQRVVLEAGDGADHRWQVDGEPQTGRVVTTVVDGDREVLCSYRNLQRCLVTDTFLVKARSKDIFVSAISGNGEELRIESEKIIDFQYPRISDTVRIELTRSCVALELATDSLQVAGAIGDWRIERAEERAGVFHIVLVGSPSDDPGLVQIPIRYRLGEDPEWICTLSGRYSDSNRLSSDYCLDASINGATYRLEEPCGGALRLVSGSGKRFAVARAFFTDQAFHVEYSLGFTSPLTIELVSLTGETIARIPTRSDRAGAYELSIPLPYSPPGVYLLRFRSGPWVDVRKVLKSSE